MRPDLTITLAMETGSEDLLADVLDRPRATTNRPRLGAFLIRIRSPKPVARDTVQPRATRARA